MKINVLGAANMFFYGKYPYYLCEGESVMIGLMSQTLPLQIGVALHKMVKRFHWTTLVNPLKEGFVISERLAKAS